MTVRDRRLGQNLETRIGHVDVTVYAACLPGETNVLRGSCMCGKVTYEINGVPLVMHHCHCRVCRAASGAAVATNIIVATEDFKVTSGQESLGAFESSPSKHRFFCSGCGSPLYSHGQKTLHYVSVRSGTLDDDPGIRPSFHAYVASKAPWVAISDELPQFLQARP